VDPQNRRVIADFGNALHTSYGALADVGPLHLIVPYTDPNSGNVLSLDLGTLDGYPGHGWYEKTAGIQAFPANRALSAAELAVVAQNPLCVATPSAVPPSFAALAVEAADGIFLRPDLFVYRIEPGTTQDVPVMALQFGRPLGNAPISAQVTVSGSQPQPNPPSALAVANAGSVQTDSTGWATISLAAADPGTPRVPDGKTGDGIDGQVYSVNVGINQAANAGTAFYPGSCFVSVLVFSKFEVPAAPGWSDVQPILRQYSNLYPRPHGPDRYVPYRGQPPLHPVVNLGDEAQVRPFAPMIARALQLPIDHPNHMPVTRDLSAGKRQALLAYVESVMAGAPELLAGPAEPAAAAGAAATKPAQAPARDFAAARAAVPPMAGGFEPEEPLGGKTVARIRAAARHAAALSTPEEK